MTPHVPGLPHDASRDETGWFLRRVRVLYRHSFSRDRRRERFFLASLGFFACFAIARALTHSMRGQAGGGIAVWWGDTHVHHLVWGILLLLAVGYVWLHEAGTGTRGLTRRMERTLALAYGVGAALTLDEFALWVMLEDVYWQKEGRMSVDAVTLFGALVSAGLWGGPFLRGIVRLVGRVIRHRSQEVAAAVAPAQDATHAATEAAAQAVEEAVAALESSAATALDTGTPAPAPVPVRAESRGESAVAPQSR